MPHAFWGVDHPFKITNTDDSLAEPDPPALALGMTDLIGVSAQAALRLAACVMRRVPFESADQGNSKVSVCATFPNRKPGKRTGCLTETRPAMSSIPLMSCVSSTWLLPGPG